MSSTDLNGSQVARPKFALIGWLASSMRRVELHFGMKILNMLISGS
jgi:hypothetical protein